MTKDRIVEAARSLMTRHGWVGTTIEAIAREAGVATATVYAAFGNKRSILTAMRQHMIDQSQIPRLMAEAASEPDRRRRLRLWAQLIRQQMETSYDIIAIHREAAQSDADVGIAYRAVLDNRARAFAEFIAPIRPALTPGVDEDTATDLLWAFSNEELWRELVHERGWSPDRYEGWLGDVLIEQLLGRRSRTHSQRTGTDEADA